MDLSDPEKKILIGEFETIHLLRRLIATLTKFRLSSELWSTSPIRDHELKQNYLYITQKRIAFPSKKILRETMSKNKKLWMLYER